MTTIPPTHNDLPELGSPTFTPLLLRYILSDPGLKRWSINPSLFSILLLSLIVGKGGIIIDCDDKGVERVQNVISGMVRTIFGLDVQHLTLNEHSELDDLTHKLSHIGYHHNHENQANPFLAQDENGAKRQQTDQAQNGTKDVLIITGLENASSPIRIKLFDVLVKKRIQVHTSSPRIDGVHEGKESVTHETEIEERKFDPLVIWVREEGSEVPSWIIDQFMLSTYLDVEDIKSPPLDLEKGFIIPNSYISKLTSLLPYVHIHATLQIHISNLLSSVSSHPSLRTTMTGKSFRCFPEYVKAHRLLSGSFDIPYSFLHPSSTSSSHDHEKQNRDDGGLGGGIGGVNTWASLAGEEPTLSEFRSETEIGTGDEVQDPYCTPNNVEGIWKVFIKHRCRKRREREEVMWLIKGSAVDGDSHNLIADAKEKNGRVRGKGHGVDKILDEILRTV